MMKLNAKKGALLAVAAAGLFAAGCASTQKSGRSSDAMVECHNINSCKGQGKCGGAGHSCAGMNACKGQGWLKTSQAECDAKGGDAKKM